MSQQLRELLQQMAQREHGGTLQRALGLVGNVDILAHAVGSNGVLLLTDRAVIYSAGKNPVQRTGEWSLDDIVISAEVQSGDLMESVVVRDRDTRELMSIKAAGDLAQPFASAVELAQDRLPPAHPAAFAVSSATDVGVPSSALILQLEVPESVDHVMSLMERLGGLRAEGLISEAQFDRVRRYLLGPS